MQKNKKVVDEFAYDDSPTTFLTFQFPYTHILLSI
jgi:hypothetical protein